MSFKQSLIFSVFFLSAFVPSFSQVKSGEGGETLKEIFTPGKNTTDELDEEDLDSIFDTAEDLEDAVVSDEVKAGTDYNVQLGSIKLPIEVSGLMNTEFGAAYVRESMKNDANFYFDFKNYLHFTTRPDKYIALKGVIKTSMPSDDEDGVSNNLLYLYEMYFEYLMLDRIYITGGKKKSVWGNIRLFSNYDDFEGDDDALYTNILYDSRNYVSGILKVPVKNHTFTALAMYDESLSGTSPGTKDMSFAASAEFIVFNTSINIFGRRFPLNYGNASAQAKNPIAGIELKRTIFGFDVYGQSMARIQNGYKIGDIFTSKFDDLSAFEKVISTAGIYNLWSSRAPYFGFNFEFQNIYRPEPSESARFFTNRFALELGMAKLGKDKNIKVALQWNHNITENCGFVQSGVILSRVMPHCDWRNGVNYEYDRDSTSFDKYKLTVGSYLTINLGY